MLCFHLGMTEGYILDYKQPTERLLAGEEARAVSAGIHEEFVRDGGRLQYHHRYEVVNVSKKVRDYFLNIRGKAPKNQINYYRLLLLSKHGASS